MSGNLSYDELAQRVRELEKRINRQRSVYDALQLADVVVNEDMIKTGGILDAMGVGVSILDTDLTILYQNSIHQMMFDNHTGEQCYLAFGNGKHICDACPVIRSFEAGRAFNSNKVIIIDEKPVYLEITASLLRNARGDIIAGIEVVRDITESKQLENLYIQSQKMETLGLLAGGIAHDFNNLLSLILGYSQLLLRKMPPTSMFRKDLEAISEAGKSAADLTSQLLAFSRKRTSEMDVVNLNGIVARLGKLFNRLLGEDIKLDLQLDKNAGNIWADSVQIWQILMNLALNARDAMPNGGCLTIKTESIELGEEHVRSGQAMRPGPHVALAVADSGVGMSRQVLDRIFEPFYTTKEPSKGTGLGLSTVNGIVKQLKGSLCVDSAPGRGTMFTLYFPVVNRAAPELSAKQKSEVCGGTERILVVDDSFAILTLVRDILTPLGYKVFTASNSKDALLLAEKEGGVDLLLTDVVMPGGNGLELARGIRNKFKGIRVVYMTGHSDENIERYGIPASGAVLLRKPLDPVLLTSTLRQVLERPAFNLSN